MSVLRSTGPVYRLAYRSFACPPWIGESILSDIARESQAVNARDGITGVLTFRDGVFLQLMEGPTVAVLGLSARIAADPRNERLRILWHGNAPERLFPTWPMGCFLATAGDRALDPQRDWTPARVSDVLKFYSAHTDLGRQPGFQCSRRSA